MDAQMTRLNNDLAPTGMNIDTLPDQALRALIAQANTLLASRAADRRKQALAQIKRLAREHGLNVSVKKPAGKRGRPPKADPA